MDCGRSFLNNEHLSSGCFKSQLTKIQCVTLRAQVLYTAGTPLWSWKGPGNFLVNMFKNLSMILTLRGPFASLEFWPSHPLWNSLPRDLSYREVALFIFSCHFSIYLWLLFLSPALWLGNFPKLGPRPLHALLFVYSPLAHLSNSPLCTGIISAMNSSQLQGPAEHVTVSSNTAYQEWNYITPFLRTFNDSSFPLRA